MKIAIVNNQAPFIRGGAEQLAEWLQTKLLDYGHQVELVRLPFQWNPAERIIDHMLAARLVRLDSADRVVALKFPAYYVRHDHKRLWMLHQFRQVYDLWGTPYQDLPDTPMGAYVRSAVMAADRHYLPQADRIYTNSKIVGHRLATYTGIASEPLYPPLFDAASYRCDGYGDYFFYPSRINAIKRQHLAVQAMAYVTSSARLVIAGPPDSHSDLTMLRDVIREHSLESRVQLIPEWISDEHKQHLLARARGVLYLPAGEDSYGYVTLEAFHAEKPVITFADSGGTLELIRDHHNGRVVPDVLALAQAMDELAEDDAMARRLGEAGAKTIGTLGISWDRVVRCLTV